MSYWTVSNGPGVDLAGGGSPDAAILDALIAAKIPPAEAQRIASALASVYTPRSELAGALEDSLKNPTGSRKNRPQTRESAQRVAEQQRQDARDGQTSLTFDNRVFVNNSLNVGGDLSVNTLRVFQDAAIDRTLAARAGAFRNLAVAGAADLGPGFAAFNAPLIANQVIVARQGGQFSGQNVFDGNVQLNGAVEWDGVACQPANVVLTKSILADGSGKVIVGAGEVRVLTDYGDLAPETLEWTYEPAPETVVQTVTTEAVTVITSVGFDADNCAVTTGTTSIFRVVSVTNVDVAGLTGDVKIISGV